MDSAQYLDYVWLYVVLDDVGHGWQAGCVQEQRQLEIPTVTKMATVTDGRGLSTVELHWWW